MEKAPLQPKTRITSDQWRAARETWQANEGIDELHRLNKAVGAALAQKPIRWTRAFGGLGVLGFMALAVLGFTYMFVWLVSAAWH